MEPEVPGRGYCEAIERLKAILLDILWTLSAFFKYGGLLLALAGVAIFGWYFVRANARAALQDTGENTVAWGGPRAVTGLKVLAAGMVVQVLAFGISAFLPGRM